jgi:hypothetical protein
MKTKLKRYAKPLAATFCLFLFMCSFIFVGCQKAGLPLASQQAKPETNVHVVPENVALSVAQNFNPSIFFDESNPYNHSSFKSTLNGKNTVSAEFIIRDSYGAPAFYIFNFADSAGFIFVSADSALRPVLAFIERGEYKKDVVPAGLMRWVNKTMNNIETVRKGLYTDSLQLGKMAWIGYFMPYQPAPITAARPEVQQPIGPPTNTAVCGLPPYPAGNVVISQWVNSIGPMLSVTWGQACSYNDLCPNINCTICGALGPGQTGCVATATAQIVNFGHPANGYNYNYASMPATYGNEEVERLMRDAGASVGMSYGCQESTATGSNAAGALTNNFGFASATYSSTYDFNTVLINNLLLGYPVMLGGCNNEAQHSVIINWTTYTNCHEWVCDGIQQLNQLWCSHGYTETNTGWAYMHMNWGWHETDPGNSDFNGWFAIDNWNITGVQLVGSSTSGANFQYSDDMITNIRP